VQHDAGIDANKALVVNALIRPLNNAGQPPAASWSAFRGDAYRSTFQRRSAEEAPQESTSRRQRGTLVQTVALDSAPTVAIVAVAAQNNRPAV